MKSKRTILDNIEDWFIKYLFYICIGGGLISTVAYKVGIIQNIRASLANVITFSSLIFVVLSLILTLLISLKGGPLFQRIKNDIPNITKEIYSFLNKIILASITVVIISLAIGVLPIEINDIVKLVISFIGFTMFLYMLLGVFYMLIFTTDLVVRDSTLTEKDKIE
ncbi:hypothetical protein [Clostridium sp.]|uniref:hypothetical protein n=1 Tax=Clostridium sp. TaxID=1506 RepID=UPI00261F1666|nr:hypothetical protein [Clostridium sp.]